MYVEVCKICKEKAEQSPDGEKLGLVKKDKCRGWNLHGIECSIDAFLSV
jgi:hypothetical protein